jgi:hypothetical protein
MKGFAVAVVLSPKPFPFPLGPATDELFSVSLFGTVKVVPATAVDDSINTGRFLSVGVVLVLVTAADDSELPAANRYDHICICKLLACPQVVSNLQSIVRLEVEPLPIVL